MIQDIYPHQLKNEFIIDYQVNPEDYVFSFTKTDVLFNNLTSSFPQVKDLENKYHYIYLFAIDQIHFVLCLDKIEESSFINYQPFYTIKEQLEHHLLYGMYTAKHLNDWYQKNKYCGCCGQELSHSKTQRALVCHCGNTIYPRLNPAVIVGVINNDKILITRYKAGYKYNALIAGFAEIGETIEQTVKREVLEETGIHVKNIHYYKSQPWGVSGDLLLGFFCEVDGDDTINFDHNELKVAHWLKPDEIELQPDNISLTNEMMALFKNKQI